VNAPRVHGGGAVLDRTSCSVGLRGQYGPGGIARLSGLEGRKSPDDMNPSSSASQSERTDEQRGEVSRDVCTYSEAGFRCFDLRIALRRYFMGTQVVLLSFLLPQTDYIMLIRTRETLVFAWGGQYLNRLGRLENLMLSQRIHLLTFSDPAVECV